MIGFILLFAFPLINELLLNVWATIAQSDEDPVMVKARFEQMKDVMPIVYSPGYNITAGGLEKLHPFDSTKYKRIWEFLHEKGTLDIFGQ